MPEYEVLSPCLFLHVSVATAKCAQVNLWSRFHVTVFAALLPSELFRQCG